MFVRYDNHEDPPKHCVVISIGLHQEPEVGLEAGASTYFCPPSEGH